MRQKLPSDWLELNQGYNVVTQQDAKLVSRASPFTREEGSGQLCSFVSVCQEFLGVLTTHDKHQYTIPPRAVHARIRYSYIAM